MIRSSIQKKNRVPTLIIDGRECPAAAYTTYFWERARYEDFVKAGYRIFFVNVSMTLLPQTPNNRDAWDPQKRPRQRG